MKKIKVMAVLAIGLAIFAITPVAFAGNNTKIGIENKNVNKATGGKANAQQNQEMAQEQGQEQGQEQISNNENNNIVLPTASLLQPGSNANLTGEYGHHITQMSLDKTASMFCGITGMEIRTMHEVMEEDGTSSWGDVDRKIISRPYVKRRFSPLGESDKIYMLTEDMAKSIAGSVRNDQIVGSWLYDSESDKNIVLPPDLQVKMIIQAAKNGVNVIVKLDQFDPKNYAPENFGGGFSGVLSALISKCLPVGYGVSGGVSASVGKNRMYVNPGAAFLLLRIDGLTDEICYQSTTVVTTKCDPSIYIERIKKAEYEISICLRYGHNNLFWRREAAKANVDAYICTGKREYLIAAINHYEMAELNYIHGYDIQKHSDSNAIIAEVEYGLASAIYARDRSIDNFWHPPEVVVHENKKTRADKPVAVTAHEKQEVMKLRRTLERYAKKLTL